MVETGNHATNLLVLAAFIGSPFCRASGTPERGRPLSAGMPAMPERRS
jgi:hypothetical protein